MEDVETGIHVRVFTAVSQKARSSLAALRPLHPNRQVVTGKPLQTLERPGDTGQRNKGQLTSQDCRSERLMTFMLLFHAALPDRNELGSSS